MHHHYTGSRLLLLLLGCLSLTAVHAQPVQLSEVEFVLQSEGLPTIVENFDAMPIGIPASPLQLANGLFVGSPQIMESAWCLFSPCMAVGLSPQARFEQLPEGASFWSARLLHASTGNVLEVSVIGNSGTQTFVLPPGFFVPEGIFVGFHDPLGLREVRFDQIAGSVNYSFDDVTVAGAAGPAPMSIPVGSPVALALLALLLVLSTWHQMRHRRGEV